ncbi:MAG: glycosyltransferase family 9 protein [Bacteriovorax sp.]
MKNVLIVNLRRLGDVYSTGHLINSLTATEGTNITLLVYKESAKAARNLKNLHSLQVIDRKEILTLKTNKLFSDGFALEQLFSQLQQIKNTKWDEIINYSNDLVGAYLCSYLRDSTSKITGVHFNNERNVVTTNDWEILFNDILPVVKYAPVHFLDCYHKMMGITLNREGEKLLTNTEHNALAFSHMNTIRKGQTGHESTTKVVGIQLKTSDASKDIPESMLTELIALIRKNVELAPVLLIAPIEEEKKYASEINAKFNDELVIIEADLEAVASVLMNIDLLITPDTAIKHIADLSDTPVLEISLGYAPFLKQGSYSQGSLVLTDIISERNFMAAGFGAETGYDGRISAQDIMASVLYFFSKTKTIRPRLSKDVTLYSCSFDQLGARYSVAAGTVDSQTEIYRLMSRQLISMIYDHSESVEIYDDIADFGLASSSTWTVKEKANVTNVMKDLLGTLRSLLQSQENRKSSREFVQHLGRLISHADQCTLTQIPVTMFKTKLESINAKSFEENAKEIEILLYNLKTDIQKILHCIKQLEEKISLLKKADFMNRNPAQINS